MSFSIVPIHLAVKAMRDNGYKNAAYALAELMDNSIQAGASNVELLCGERDVLVSERTRSRVHQIGVLDDGDGMDKETLRFALQFGNGAHLEESAQKGIGRFGMGLPASSISQCRKVEVWTWQNGVDNAIYSFLDLDKIINKEMSEVPDPCKKEIPLVWKEASKFMSNNGTLVVWSSLDKLMWKNASTIIDNSEFVIGRMYRRFLESGRVNIRMAGFDLDNSSNVRVEKAALPNDPGYLMTGTSTPQPYNSKPMFEKWGGEDFEVKHIILFRGKKCPVSIRYTFAKEEARQGAQPGQRPYGKHAARNAGLSVVRAERELELDTTWTNPSDPRDRWWGVEVDFPPALDDLFGVTNNKQHAHNLSELANFDFDEALKGGVTITQLKEDLISDDDPRVPLLEIAHQVSNTLGVLRRLLKAQTKSEENSSGKRHAGAIDSVESKATVLTQQRKESGFAGQSDEDEKLPEAERIGILEQTLIDEGVPKELAKEMAAITVSNGLKYVFAEADLETSAFFSVKQRGGSIVITLNTSHPAYSSLVDVLERSSEGSGETELEGRLKNALDGLKLLLMAWARYEDEQPDGSRRAQAQDTRVDWGRIARQFLFGE
ncbi:ATP-binding protein [Geopsychrobacter electrodiphilus]|uniref:ATP-binding protein n=1 Tax=Geopsychrobacter electrodiphilus TaxID=225196 RepID=UPI00037B485B|nr:ATP-binding protein [Geopsychrobacter electrodiphilus]